MKVKIDKRVKYGVYGIIAYLILKWTLVGVIGSLLHKNGYISSPLVVIVPVTVIFTAIIAYKLWKNRHMWGKGNPE